MASEVLATMRRGAMRKLPYDAEVEYLESTGTQYIDTRIKTSTNDIMYECKCKFSEILNRRQLMGADHGYYFGLSTSGYYEMGTGFEIRVRFEKAVDIIYERIGNTNRLTIEDVSVIRNYSSIKTGLNIFLFLLNTDLTDPYSVAPLFQIYNFSIYVSGKKVIDFIPVRFTNSLGVSEGAMYDRVSGQLFRNAGTGAFVIGPDKAVQTFTDNLGVLMPQKEVEA